MSEKSQNSNSAQIEKVSPFVHHKILVYKNEDEKPNSLALWMTRYYQVHVAGSFQHTRLAKMSDLQKFLLFFSHHIGSDQVDFWTPTLH